MIRHFYILVLLLVANITSYAQFNGIDFEGFFRDSVNTNADIEVRIYATGHINYYEEVHSINIDTTGKWWLTIGDGVRSLSSELDSLYQVDFSLDSIGIAVSVDFGSTTYQVLDKQLKNVPYAFHSKTIGQKISVNTSLSDVDTIGIGLDYIVQWDGTAWELNSSFDLSVDYAMSSEYADSSDSTVFSFYSHVPFADTVFFANVTDSANFALASYQTNFADSAIYVDTANYARSGSWGLGGNALVGTEYFGSNNAMNVPFYTSGLERLTISSEGNVGIGFLDTASLHIVGNEGLLFEGSLGAGTHVSLVGGDYCYYSPTKSSFMGGRNTDTLWDDSNIGIYSFSYGNKCWVKGDYSAAFGDSCHVFPISSVPGGTGEYALAVGKQCGASGKNSFSTGNNSFAYTNRSVAMGYRCSTPYGYACIAMGCNAIADGNIEPAVAIGENILNNGKYSIALGRNIDMNYRRGCFLYADRSTTDTLVAPAPIGAGSLYDNKFIVRSAGGVIFYSDSNLISGVQLFPGAGSWSSLSDSSKKQNIKKLPISSALSKINNINVYEWNYKSQDTSVKHVGPMAQDFHKAFGLGNSNLAITSVDMDGVILLGVQGVNNRLDSMYEQLNNTILNSNLNYASISNRLRILESVTKKME